MFPITHIYCVKKLISDTNGQHFLGSVFPDIVITGIMKRTETHYGEIEIVEYFKKYPDLIGFAKGLFSHNTLDYYCDEDPTPREGYAFKKSKELISDVQKATGLNDIMSLVRSHNFIELAMDIMLLEENPELLDDLNLAKKEIENEKLMKSIGEYYKKNAQDIKNALKEYFEIIPIPLDVDCGAEGLVNVFKIKDNVDVKKEDIVTITQKAIGIIKDKFKYDLDDMISKAKEKMPK